MSLVNKMLQELDRRHAAEPVTATPESILGQRVRPTRQSLIGSEWFWRVLAVLIVAAIAWVGWVSWELRPRSNVTPLAMQAAARVHAPVAQAPVPPPVAGQPPAPAVQPPAAAAASSARPETLALARELSMPLRPAPGAPGAEKRVPAVKAVPQAAGPARALATKGVPKTEAVSAQSASGRIDKRDSSTPRERAEVEFHRAVTFVNQGRLAEGMDAFRTALALDPGYETARQTQVSLLLDARRMDEAAASLQEGLALNPQNLPFAMLLARIMVERNDVSSAFALLQTHAAGAENSAEYHSFVAALYQRLGRYREAGDEYQNALRLAPQNAAWWVGLGMSLESQKRGKDAAEAFRRARNSGPLSPELTAYVDQRLKALP